MPGWSLIVALASALFFAAGAQGQAAPERLPLEIEASGGSHRFMVELATTSEQRSRGLMFRREMGADEGMLFDFDSEREVTMWMHNTYLPLDMVFIGADGRVKTVAERTTPLSDRIISSRVPVRFVLEINAGRAAEAGIRPGDRVSGAAIAPLLR
ncbi:DUF192 domain-containing protein [Propylenella binzhouense]|uniref:DUF192 domain-containing protein n=1 Tax=Propylenella binzhouense TaxID=2555902 RepID=A0A964T426_9HYPH|nr:DUF192 domain-containing protein [Propylenella binzhouense]MYZ48101.1 DUF192 domain-containing protein [Propylenella binzhouense]